MCKRWYLRTFWTRLYWMFNSKTHIYTYNIVHLCEKWFTMAPLAISITWHRYHIHIHPHTHHQPKWRDKHCASSQCLKSLGDVKMNMQSESGWFFFRLHQPDSHNWHIHKKDAHTHTNTYTVTSTHTSSSNIKYQPIMLRYYILFYMIENFFVIFFIIVLLKEWKFYKRIVYVIYVCDANAKE